MITIAASGGSPRASASRITLRYFWAGALPDSGTASGSKRGLMRPNVFAKTRLESLRSRYPLLEAPDKVLHRSLRGLREDDQDARSWPRESIVTERTVFLQPGPGVLVTLAPGRVEALVELTGPHHAVVTRRVADRHRRCHPAFQAPRELQRAPSEEFTDSGDFLHQAWAAQHLADLLIYVLAEPEVVVAEQVPQAPGKRVQPPFEHDRRGIHCGLACGAFAQFHLPALHRGDAAHEAALARISVSAHDEEPTEINARVLELSQAAFYFPPCGASNSDPDERRASAYFQYPPVQRGFRPDTEAVKQRVIGVEHPARVLQQIPPMPEEYERLAPPRLV